MKSVWKSLPAATCAAVAFAVLPSAAFAVNVSSNDGVGTQTVREWMSRGAVMTGKLKSVHGDPVYYNGTVVFDSYPDISDGRYSLNVTNTSYTTAGGNLGSNGSGREADGVKTKICRARNNLPDPCGSNSSTIRR